MDWLWFGLSGLVSGVIAGMGMGGGTLLIPILTIFLEVEQHNAQGINLLAFVPTAVVAIVIHAKNKLISFKVGIPIIIGGIISAIVGSLIAMQLSSQVLKRVFGVFLLLIGIWQIVFTIVSSKDSNKMYRANINLIKDK